MKFSLLIFSIVLGATVAEARTPRIQLKNRLHCTADNQSLTWTWQNATENLQMGEVVVAEASFTDRKAGYSTGGECAAVDTDRVGGPYLCFSQPEWGHYRASLAVDFNGDRSEAVAYDVAPDRRTRIGYRLENPRALTCRPLR